MVGEEVLMRYCLEALRLHDPLGKHDDVVTCRWCESLLPRVQRRIEGGV
jgi:hypothetical protein